MKKKLGVLLVAVIALFATAGVAQAQNLSWSTAARVNGVPITQIDCPTATQCTVLDSDGVSTYENTFAPGQPTRSTRQMVAGTPKTGQLACPSATECVVGDTTGHLTVFNPVARTKPVSFTASTTAIDAVACPLVTECVTVDAAGKEQIFNPRKLGAALRTGVVSAATTRLSCPTTTECVAIGVNGAETFDPVAPPETSAVSYLIDGATPLIGVSCPTAQDCNVLDAVGKVLTFNPLTLGTKPVPRSTAAPAASVPIAISCDFPTHCVVVAARGNAHEGNPRTGHWVQEVFQHHGALTAVACPRADVCLAADSQSWIYWGTTPATSFRVLAGNATTGYVSVQLNGVTVVLACSGVGNRACTFVLKAGSSAATGPAATRTITLRTGKFGPVKVTLTKAQAAALRRSGKLTGTLTVYQKPPGSPEIVLLRRTFTITV
jgi:hypothetical protein